MKKSLILYSYVRRIVCALNRISDILWRHRRPIHTVCHSRRPYVIQRCHHCVARSAKYQRISAAHCCEIYVDSDASRRSRHLHHHAGLDLWNFCLFQSRLFFYSTLLLHVPVYTVNVCTALLIGIHCNVFLLQSGKFPHAEMSGHCFFVKASIALRIMSPTFKFLQQNPDRLKIFAPMGTIFRMLASVLGADF